MTWSCNTDGTWPSKIALAMPSTIAVLPTPGSPTKMGLFLRRRASTWMARSTSARASDQRVDASRRRLLHEVDGVGRQRIVGRLARLLVERVALGLLVAVDLSPRQRSVFAILLRDPVRDVVEHVEPLDALLLEQPDRVRIALAKERDQQVAAVDGVLARGLHVHRRPLQRAPERRRLLRLALGPLRQLGHVLVEELLQILLQLLQVGARRLQDLHGDGIFGQREQDVLERHELVPPPPRLVERELNRAL